VSLHARAQEQSISIECMRLAMAWSLISIKGPITVHVDISRFREYTRTITKGKVRLIIVYYSRRGKGGRRCSACATSVHDIRVLKLLGLSPKTVRTGEEKKTRQNLNGKDDLLYTQVIGDVGTSFIHCQCQWLWEVFLSLSFVWGDLKKRIGCTIFHKILIYFMLIIIFIKSCLVDAPRLVPCLCHLGSSLSVHACHPCGVLPVYWACRVFSGFGD
jgi:hypothetical protein